MKQSGFLSLGWRDFLRGLVIAILTPVATVITDSLDKGIFNPSLRLIVLSAIGGFVAYIIKNLVTKPDAPVKIMSPNPDPDPEGPGGSNPPSDPKDK